MLYKEEIEMKKYLTPFASVLTLKSEDIITASADQLDSITTSLDSNGDFGGFILFG